MKTALTLLFLTAAIIGCSAEQDPVADVSQAYMLSIEPCESTFQGKIVKWVTIGSSSSSTVTKIRVAYNSTDPVAPNYTRTLTAQVIPTSGATPTTGCWDRFPSQIPESWTSDSQNPPGTSGYYIGTYPNNEFVDIYGSGGVVNNDPWNPASWVRVVVAVSSWGVYVQHRWLMNASDPYTWTQEY